MASLREIALALLCYASITACRAAPPGFAGQQKTELVRGTARGLQSSGDGTQWLVVNEPRDVRLYTALNAQPRQRALEDLQFAGWLADQRVFLASRARVELWSPDLSQRQAELLLPAHDPPLSGRWTLPSPGGRYLARDYAVYDTQAQRWRLEAEPHGHQTALAFSGESWLLTAGFHDRAVVVRDLTRDQKYVWQASQRVTSAVFDPERKRVHVGTEDGAFAWPIASKNATRIATGKVVALCLSTDGQHLALLGERSVRVIEASSTHEGATFPIDAQGTGIACDGALIAAGDERGRVYAWDANRGRTLAAQAVLQGAVSGLAISARSRRVLASSSDARAATLVLLDLPAP